MSSEPPEPKFVVDRMLGTLTRYLRLMGYDSKSATELAEGNPKEDSLLLELAFNEKRLLLTKDAELARRGQEQAILIGPDDVIAQLRQLIDSGIIKNRLTMSRCSICNTELREANTCEIENADYAPKDWRNLSFFWCETCKKLYWNGSHGKQLEKRMGEVREDRSGTQ
jgi:uncharacterized protein with PIN domain